MMTPLKSILTLMVIAGLAVFPRTAPNAAETVIDAAGRKIAADVPYARIISLYGAHTRNLMTLDAGAQVIGISPSDQWDGKPAFSYHDGLEKFLAARPDLVLVRPMIDRAYSGLISGMEKAGIVVASLQPSSIEDMFDYWLTLGDLTGKRAEAREMVSIFNTRTKQIIAATQTLPRKKRVYFEAIHSRMKTFTPGSMAIFALETAGGINLAQDAAPVRGTNIAYYGKERILSHAREIDVFLSQKGAMNQPTIEMIKHEPGFDIIRAVKENQIFIVDEITVSRPTMDLLKGIQTIGTMLYPDLFGSAGLQ